MGAVNVRRTAREPLPQPLSVPAPSSDTRAAIASEEVTRCWSQGRPEAEARRSIIRTLNRDPYDVWTRDSLARATGISSGLAARVLADLVRSGMVHRLAGPDGEYTVAGADY